MFMLGLIGRLFMKKSTMFGGFKGDPDALTPAIASSAGEFNPDSESSPDSGESASESLSGTEGTDEPPPAAQPVAAVLPPDPPETATSGEILKFLDDTAKARKEIRKAEDEARSNERKAEDAAKAKARKAEDAAISQARKTKSEADNEVDKAWRVLMRLRLAQEARANAMTPAAPQLPLE